MSEHMMPIPSRLYNAAVGGHVCGPEDVDFGQKVVHLIKYDRAGNEVSFESQVTQANKIYVIHDDFVLSSNVTIPANCVLEFDGGSIKNGTLSYSNTIIKGINTSNCQNVNFTNTLLANDEIVFSTVQKAVEYPYFIHPGTLVRTLGYYAEGDGGGNEYYFDFAATGQTYDHGSKIQTANGVLNIIPKSTITFRQFGAKPIEWVILSSNPPYNSSTEVQELFDYTKKIAGQISGKCVSVIVDGCFAIGNVIVDNSYGAGMKICGVERNASRLMFIGDGYSSGDAMDGHSCIFEFTDPIGNMTFENIKFEGSYHEIMQSNGIVSSVAHHALYFPSNSNTSFNGSFKKCVFHDFVRSGLYINNSLNTYFCQCSFECPGKYAVETNSISNMHFEDCSNDMRMHDSQYRPTSYLNIMQQLPWINTAPDGVLYDTWTWVRSNANNNINSIITFNNCRVEGISDLNNSVVSFKSTSSPVYPNTINIVGCSFSNLFEYAASVDDITPPAGSILQMGINVIVTASYNIAVKLQNFPLNYSDGGLTDCITFKGLTSTEAASVIKTIDMYRVLWGLPKNNGVIIDGKKITVNDSDTTKLSSEMFYGDIILTTNRVDGTIYNEAARQFMGQEVVYPIKGFGVAEIYGIDNIKNQAVTVIDANTIQSSEPLKGNSYRIYSNQRDSLCWVITGSNNAKQDILLLNETKNGNNYVYTTDIPLTVPTGNATLNPAIFRVMNIGRKEGAISGNSRPTEDLYVGQVFFDTTLGKPIYWNGTAWVDATGATV